MNTQGHKGQVIARCTVERLMRKLGLQCVVRGKRAKTTISRADDVYPLDRVKRQFSAPRPNALWMADFTYVPTWQDVVYVAFVVDVFSRFIVGWKVSTGVCAGCLGTGYICPKTSWKFNPPQ